MMDIAENLCVRIPELEPDDPFADLDDEGAAPFWPRLADLSLSRSQFGMRRERIGGSDANMLLSGNSERIQRLWAEKFGEIEPADLSGIVAVALGTWTKPFNRQWYEGLTGQRVERVGQTGVCPDPAVASMHARWFRGNQRRNLEGKA